MPMRWDGPRAARQRGLPLIFLAQGVAAAAGRPGAA